MTFEARKYVGDMLERRVACELDERRWSISPFGQGQLSPPVQRGLARTTCALRFLPDIVGVRGGDVVTIDAKSRMPGKETNRYYLRKEAVRAGHQFSALMDLPLFYVFDDLRVLTPFEVIAADRWTRRPYYTIDSSAGRRFNDVFGHPSGQLSLAA